MDVHSLQLATAITFAVMACFLMLFRVNVAQRVVVRFWLASRTALAIAYFGYAYTDFLPRWLAVHTGNLIALTGLFLEVATVYRFFQPRRSLLQVWAVAAGALSVAVFLAVSGLDNSVRLSLLNLVFSIPFVLIVGEYANYWRDGSRLLRFLTLSIAGIALVILARGLSILLSDPALVAEYRDLSTRIFFVLFFLAAQVQGFGFLFLLKEDSDEALERLTGQAREHAVPAASGEDGD